MSLPQNINGNSSFYQVRGPSGLGLAKTTVPIYISRKCTTVQKIWMGKTTTIQEFWLPYKKWEVVEFPSHFFINTILNFGQEWLLLKY